MKLKALFVCLVALSASHGFSAAQTAAEISMAKTMARSYGYTESEINSVLNHDIDNKKSESDPYASPSPDSLSTSLPFRTKSSDVKQAVPRSKAKSSDAKQTVPLSRAKYPEYPDATRAVSMSKAKSSKARPNNPVSIVSADSAVNSAKGIYGQDFFISRGLSIIPSYNAPAPSGYVLGPGDEVIVDVWGAAVSHVVATITNEGSINMAGLGPVYLAGMKLSEAENSLKSELSRIYSGLAIDDSGDTFLKLSIGKIKGVVVSITGEVRTPGAYTIPSLTSLPSAIFLAGGLGRKGSVRNINLYRGGRKVAGFDLYDYIFKGVFNENLRLQDGDIINVPAYTTVASISGAVIREYKYEMKENETVKDLLDYALGFASRAQRSELNLIRNTIEGGKAFDIAESEFSSFKIKDGDVVSARYYNVTNQNRITIGGPVKFPGAYAIDGDIKDLKSLINAAGGIVEGAYTLRGQIRRLDSNRVPVFLTFNLKKVLDGEENVKLVREDSVTLYRTIDMKEQFKVTIRGHVMTPGSYDFFEGMTVADLILLANGVRDNAFTERGQISRTSEEGIPTIIPFSVADVEEGLANINLVKNDSVHIYSVQELQDTATITINGMINRPVTVAYREGMTLKDILLIGHNFANGADKTNIEIASRGGRERGTVMVCDIENNPKLLETALKPYDIVSVRKLTYFRKQTAVKIEGEVVSPGTYVVDKPTVRLSDIIAKCGGFTPEAYPHGASLRRTLTKEEMERIQLALKIAVQNRQTGVKIDSTMIFETSFLIGIDIEKAIKKPGSTDDVILRAGDEITVPQCNNTVKVSGSVFYPNTLTYEEGKTWKQYVQQAGGFKRSARPRKTYAIYMNGKVATGNNIKSEPGMEIIVPEYQRDGTNRMSIAEMASLASSTTSIAALILELIRR